MKQTILYHRHDWLSYGEYGDPKGYPILVQHGLIASITADHLFKRLIHLGKRVICIARPGYGDSTPYEMRTIAEWGDIIASLAYALDLPKFDVLGISSGAPYSYAVGYRLPEKTRNIFILSGTPALFDKQVCSHWPYPINRDASIAELQKLAFELFFAHLSTEDLAREDIRDSMSHDCFGIALDLRIRCNDWGFRLADIQPRVIMRHSRSDASVPFITAELTAKMLPNCRFEVRENDPHFSEDVLDDFIRTSVADR